MKQLFEIFDNLIVDKNQEKEALVNNILKSSINKKTYKRYLSSLVEKYCQNPSIYLARLAINDFNNKKIREDFLKQLCFEL
jgi:hypothetical protein